MNELKITFLGSGSAFYNDVDNFQSNLLLECQGRSLLLDCGTDIRFSMREAGKKLTDVTDVYISHAHADHIGGLECLGFIKKFTPNSAKPNLYASSLIVKDLWDRSLAGGMESMQGELADLSTFFEVHRIRPNSSFVWCGIEFKIVQTIHIMNGFMFVPSFGLMFTVQETFDNGSEIVSRPCTIFFTSDSQHAPNQIMDFYKMADVIFQDCETTPWKSGVHAHYTDLVTLPDEVKRKMWLYHFNQGPLPAAHEEGFKGFVPCRKEFSFSVPDTK